MSTGSGTTVATVSGSNALTTAYTGWVGKTMDVRAFDRITVKLGITKGDAATLTLKPQVSDADLLAANADDYADVMKADADRDLTAEEITRTIGAATEKISFTYDTQGISLLRFLAKVDVGTGSPSMSMRVWGWSDEHNRDVPLV